MHYFPPKTKILIPLGISLIAAKNLTQNLETADGNYELKGGGTQLSILTPNSENFSDNEEFFNKCVSVIPNMGINLKNDIPSEVKSTSSFN